MLDCLVGQSRLASAALEGWSSRFPVGQICADLSRKNRWRGVSLLAWFHEEIRRKFWTFYSSIASQCEALVQRQGENIADICNELHAWKIYYLTQFSPHKIIWIGNSRHKNINFALFYFNFIYLAETLKSYSNRW